MKTYDHVIDEFLKPKEYRAVAMIKNGEKFAMTSQKTTSWPLI